jgi:glucose/mannose transport system substrate-binding protein
MHYRSVLAFLATSTFRASAGPAGTVDLEVTHWWTCGGETVAAKVLADSYDSETERRLSKRRRTDPSS